MNASTAVVEESFTTETSRKNQQIRTEQFLQDEAKRAEYMSTYHARPFEMDRKSGAVSKIKVSEESTYIFRKYDDDDSIQSDNMENTEMEAGEKNNCPFLKCGLHPNIVRAITSSKISSWNLKRPTVIQRTAWEQILIKKDYKENISRMKKNLFVSSETGSGKTLAYLLPIIQHLAIDSKTFQPKKVDRTIGGTRAIILCPTRELTTQTAIVAEKVCQNSFPWLVAGCLSGGEKRKSEKARLRKGISILIATPGRLLDHLTKTDCLMMALKGKVEWIVLDESDRLLDMGLGSQVEQIVQMVRANQPKSGVKRNGITWQSALVSATINDKVQSLASKLLGGDIWVWARGDSNKERLDDNDSLDIAKQPSKLEFSNSTPQQLSQHHMIVSSKLRLTALVSFLTTRVQKKERIVIFMSTCDGVDFHHKLLSSMQPIFQKSIDSEDRGNFEEINGVFGKSCSLHKLHGNIAQDERHKIMSRFTDMKSSGKEGTVLITTDVAARGLNLPSVDWIVQYDPPCEISDYIHRAGRAARAGKAGHALLFLLPSESQYVEVLNIRGMKNMTALSLTSTLQAAAKCCPDLTEEGLAKSGMSRQQMSSSRVGEAFTVSLQERMEDCILDDTKAYKVALSKKVLPHGDDKEQIRKQKREAKHAIGPLLESARRAYSAYIRSYSTKEKVVRHIFSIRALHLGHVAKSFALREQPKELSKSHRNSRNKADKDDNKEYLKSTGRKRSSQLAFRNNRQSSEVDTEKGDDVIGDKSSKGKNKKKKVNKSSNTAAARTVSFLDASDIHAMQKSQPEGIKKANMLATALRMQENGMEFF